MAHISESRSVTGGRIEGQGTLFGVPMGDLGWFTSLVMSLALGFAGFFAATFCGIVGILFYNSATHRAVDYAFSYMRIGIPVGIATLLVALGYLGTLWVKRKLRRA